MQYIPLSCTSSPCNLLFLNRGIYGRRRDRINLGLLRSFYRVAGGGGVRKFDAAVPNLFVNYYHPPPPQPLVLLRQGSRSARRWSLSPLKGGRGGGLEKGLRTPPPPHTHRVRKKIFFHPMYVAGGRTQVHPWWSGAQYCCSAAGTCYCHHHIIGSIFCGHELPTKPPPSPLCKGRMRARGKQSNRPRRRRTVSTPPGAVRRIWSTAQLQCGHFAAHEAEHQGFEPPYNCVRAGDSGDHAAAARCG